MLGDLLQKTSQQVPPRVPAKVLSEANPRSVAFGVSPMLSSFVEQTWSQDTNTIGSQISEYFKYTLGRTASSIDNLGMYLATSKSLRDRLIDRFNCSQEAMAESKAKQICYLSLEYLMGRALSNALYNLDLTESYHQALEDLGFELEDIAAEEVDAALGNGGLGRLAACFADSMATLSLPSCGYGLRYRYGMFKQIIENGFQVAAADKWERHGAPWEVERFDVEYPVRFYGHTSAYLDKDTGTYKYRHEGGQVVKAVAYDTLVPGFNTPHVMNLRLWHSAPSEEFSLAAHNVGDYYASVAEKMDSENITAVLYPNDGTHEGRMLRIKQEFFFVSATMQDILAKATEYGVPFDKLDERFVIQLNDTHPTLAIPELMRLLMDVYNYGWEAAWAVVNKVFAYTNHTVLPEALETWPTHMLASLLPRHTEIIFEINRRWIETVTKTYPNDADKIHRMAIVADDRVRMANLCVVASFAVNGVAQIHSEIIKADIFPDFATHWPEKFQNKTNGVTPRRWIAQSNRELAELITERLQSRGLVRDERGWPANLKHLRELASDVADTDVLERINDIKFSNKARLAEVIKRECGVEVSPEMLFDIQVKRIHEYKRQLMNIVSVVARWREIKAMTTAERKKVVPRCVAFAGKAATSYERAKQTIRLITAVADTLNKDEETNQYLKVVFIPNYSVSLAQVIVPAADINEQISTAGTEASGTSCMKFVMNGSPIIGTLDGSNIEIREDIGEDNMFIFGLKAHEIAAEREKIHRGTYKINPTVASVFNDVKAGVFGSAEYLRPLCDAIIGHDFYLVSADFDSYHEARWNQVDTVYTDRMRWAQICLYNIALSYRFSSDRTISQYATEIWGVKPLKLRKDIGPARMRYTQPSSTE